MNRIDGTFDSLRKEGRKAFIAYLTAGDPTLETTLHAALGLVRGGVDIIELGLPFSDPLADGPVIQAAGQRALSAGFTLDRFWNFVSELRSQVTIPLTIMTYYNPVLYYGPERFAQRAASAGIDALLVPDLPIEESSELESILERNGLYSIRFIAPTTSPTRMKLISETAKGFLYCVSLTGVTGERQNIAQGLPVMLGNIREHTDLPLCVGFGVSNAEQAGTVGQFADGVIIGSAIVRCISDTAAGQQSFDAVYESVRQFAARIRSVLDDGLG